MTQRTINHAIKKATSNVVNSNYHEAISWYIKATINTPALTELLIPSIERCIKKARANEGIATIIDGITLKTHPNEYHAAINNTTKKIIAFHRTASSNEKPDYLYDNPKNSKEFTNLIDLLLKSSCEIVETASPTGISKWTQAIHAAISPHSLKYEKILQTLDADLKLSLPFTAHLLLSNKYPAIFKKTHHPEFKFNKRNEEHPLYRAIFRISGDKAQSHEKTESILKEIDHTSFLHKLFQATIKRTPQPHEEKHYLNTLNKKENTKESLIKLLIDGQEHKNISTKEPSNQNRVKETNNLFEIPKPWDIATEDIRIPTFDYPLVSIVIPVYGKPEFTIACIRSIAQNSPKCTYEILILDDKSPDNSAEILKDIVNIRVIENKTNLGFLKSCNYGIPLANGKYIFLLNNDTAVLPDFLDKLLDVFKTKSDAGIVGSKLLYPNGALQEAGGILWQDGSAWNFGKNQDPRLPKFNYLREADYCSGAAILFEKKFFIEAGKFDENLAPAYYEDTDFCFTTRKFGKKVYLQPKSLVIHHEGVSHGTSVSHGLKAYQEKNLVKFKEKWKDSLSDHFENGVHVSIAKDRIYSRDVTLVIDHYVPQIDKDAGSRSTWHILQCLNKNLKCIKFWPDNHFYDPIYSHYLEEIGIEVIAGNATVDKFKEWLEENNKFIKNILLNRPHIAIKYIDEIKKYPDIKIIYYGHDIHYHRLEKQQAANPKTNIQKEIKQLQNQEEWIWNNVDTIYYPSDDEINWLRKQPELKQKVLRSIPVYAYPKEELNLIDKKITPNSALFIGGFRHSPNAEAAIRLVKNIWPRVLKEIPSAKLYIVGSHPTADILKLKSASIEILGHISDEKLEEIYKTVTISVAPLSYGGGMKGKIIESMKHGTPVVTTSVGAQGLSTAKDIISVSDNDIEFSNNVIELFKNNRKNKKLATASIDFINKNFSQSSLWRIINNDFQ
jgi:GT2 family glycosyltransferase